ncbi:class D sortase [Planococcus sp. CP5-4]|uniref:class D sortase n=1 Tax=unclassified Planococcus (in: firmicutes) TaxID=2662419 RepID=UPI001C24571E|nr:MULTISPECIES: class D sortase [unclassified Planococcus (in: firmicutes)]MBU9671833.1 class D sortase [Planococcus sp. CP5-4_YE]MBV0909153.1 class D sortase [Planococcus sp. CP5-4_UN]MBW6063645.1 class D sortase [Planococcus sp. CP5-4]
MNKVYTIIIVAGLLMSGYFGFQWWQSSQAAETVSLEEIEGWNHIASSSMEPSNEPASESSLTTVQEPPPIMSNDMNDYEQGEEVGRLVIPAIETGYATYWGADEATLDQGVGMYVSEWTTTPDQQRHTVLSGHRDTVFTGLDEMEKGDSVFLEYEGQRYEYAVEKIWITDAEDRTVIVDKNEATLTLTTCYPFDYIGYAPERYIIQGTLVEIQEMQ